MVSEIPAVGGGVFFCGGRGRVAFLRLWGRFFFFFFLVIAGICYASFVPVEDRWALINQNWDIWKFSDSSACWSRCDQSLFGGS